MSIRYLEGVALLSISLCPRQHCSIVGQHMQRALSPCKLVKLCFDRSEIQKLKPAFAAQVNRLEV